MTAAPAYGGPTLYAREAMEGLDLLNQLMDPGRRAALVQKTARERERLEAGERLCLADFAADAASGRRDYVALFVTTCGAGVRETAAELKRTGEYVKCHVLQALAIESAESIGVKLTEGYMMDPEASVSALVFHHPEARYFSAVAGG